MARDRWKCRRCKRPLGDTDTADGLCRDCFYVQTWGVLGGQGEDIEGGLPIRHGYAHLSHNRRTRRAGLRNG